MYSCSLHLLISKFDLFHSTKIEFEVVQNHNMLSLLSTQESDPSALARTLLLPGQELILKLLAYFHAPVRNRRLEK